jgi:MoxR-like ATPase
LTTKRMFDELGSPLPPPEFRALAEAIVGNIEQVIEGKTATVRLALAVLLAEGHLLIEDVPGVGKTKLAKALARSIDCTVRRIQFTPDLLPSDVTGVSVYNQESRDFEFKPGAVFANIVVGDEINRASPKTQSALLECMEEKQVTVDGVTYPLQTPFMVIATQNPIEMEGTYPLQTPFMVVATQNPNEMEGTYPLPEAQRDRFTARIAMGYPDAGAELAMLDVHGAHDPLHDLRPVSDANMVRRMIATVRDVHVADTVKQYAVDLVTATRESPDLRLGASPRATLHLLRTARAVAALENRDYVVPDDLQNLAVPVLAHRIIPTAEAQLARRTTDSIVADLVTRLALPTDRQPRSPYDTRTRQQSTVNPYDPRRR